MPNGGSDCCGECVFNVLNQARPGGIGRDDRAWCEIRGFAPGLPFWTYCANYHTRDRTPSGPVFSYLHDWGRLPWHGAEEPGETEGDEPCDECGERRTRLAVADPPGRRGFCGPEHYLAWWRRAHSGETGEYPWRLHDAMFDPRRRASGHDAPHGLRERLLALLRH